MKPIYILSIFVVVVLAQLFVPAKMIFDQENVIRSGQAYKFKTEPVDPSDPFKGKYIYLNYEATSVQTTDSTWAGNDIVYVEVIKDSLGFAMANGVSREIYTTGDYVKASVNWYDYNEKILNFSYPFDEFYMNETKAYDAEVAHREAQNDSLPNNTYALVYLLNGQGVLDNVFINDIPISEYVEKPE